MNRDDNHMTGDKGAFIYEILLDAICCVMCADKKITTQERKAVHKILHKTKSPWSDEDIDEKIGVFVQRLKKEGSRKIIQETCSRLPEFSKVGKEQILLKCIDYMADADGEIHEETALSMSLAKALRLSHHRVLESWSNSLMSLPTPMTDYVRS